MASSRIRDAVGIDPDRVVSAALEAALGDGRQRTKRHPGRLLAAGAALAAATAVGQRRMPRLAKVPLRMGLHKLGDMAHVDELADALRDRLAGQQDEPDEDYYDDEELEQEEDFDDEEDGFDDEDEGFDDGDGPEDDDGPRGEGDEVDEEDPEDDEPDGGEPEEEPAPEAEDEDEELEAEDEDEDEDEELDPDEEDEDIAARSVPLGNSRDENGRAARDRAPDLFAALLAPHRRPPVMRRDARRLDPAAQPPEPDHDDTSGATKNQKPKAARA